MPHHGLMVHLLFTHQHETKEAQLNGVLLITFENFMCQPTEVVNYERFGPFMDDQVHEESESFLEDSTFSRESELGHAFTNRFLRNLLQRVLHSTDQHKALGCYVGMEIIILRHQIQ